MAIDALIAGLPSFPLLCTHKPFSGKLRRDFRAIFDSPDPAMKLALIEPHLDRDLTSREVNAAIPLIELAAPTWGGGIGPFHVAAIICCHPDCEQLSTDIRVAFRFRDKSSPRWSTIYGIAAHINSVPCVEVGVTEIDLSDLVRRLRNLSVTGRDTRLSRFQRSAMKAGSPCYLWPLECYPGDLDEAQAITMRWRVSAIASGFSVPQQTTSIIFRDQRMTLERRWPSFDSMAHDGIEIASGR